MSSSPPEKPNKTPPGKLKPLPFELHGYVVGNPNKTAPGPNAVRFSGLIAALLIYDHALSDKELKKVEDYLYLYYFKKP